VLLQASINIQAAAENLANFAVRTAASAPGFQALAAALQAEVQAGALTCQYPPGLTTTVVGTPLELRGGGVAPASAAAAATNPGAPTEPEIAVFRTQFAKHSPAPPVEAAAAAASGASAYEELQETCAIIDALLERVRRWWRSGRDDP
jgi:hypothetical protein